MTYRSAFAILFFIVLTFFSLAPMRYAKASSSMNNEVKAVLQMQADAWNNGELDKFLTGYSQSEDISFVSGESQTWGYASLRNRYVKKYGDSKATMGKLTFSNLKVQELGKNNALCIGHWLVEKSDKSTIGGIFSLVLRREKSGWKIIHDHTSVTP